MKGSKKQPRVFVSYSWSSPQHEQWVINFAERLSSDGVFVILDKWDLKEGQDKHVFMERMVNDKKINKVLVVCDSSYQRKANDRKGGVGTESQLISKKVYENTRQEKFIPIIKEYDEANEPCLPHFISNRKYIDLSSDQIFEENYQKLVRTLYKKPLQKRPPVGGPPSYIIEEDPIVLKTSHKVAEIKRALVSGNQNADGFIADYLDTFLVALEDFRLKDLSSGHFDDHVVQSIEQTTPLRDDFIEFFLTILKFQKEINLDLLHSFFENLARFNFKPRDVQEWREIDFDNYKFIIYELFLYSISILLKLKKYREAGFLIHNQYFYRNQNSELRHAGVVIFNQYNRSLDQTRNQRLTLRRISVTADLIKSRANREEVDFESLKEADLILFYLTELRLEEFIWFPRTSVYNSRSSGIEIFERLISKRYFDLAKPLFDIQSVNELRSSINEYSEKIKSGALKRQIDWDYEINSLSNVLKLENICTTE
jgi:hypothetical protein